MAHLIDDHFHGSDVNYTESNSTPFLSSDSIRDQASSVGELMSTSDGFLSNFDEGLHANYGQVGIVASQGLTSAVITAFNRHDGYDGYDDWCPSNSTSQGIDTRILANYEP